MVAAAGLGAALAHARTAGTVVIEEFLDGPEVSLFALADGVTAVPLLPAQAFDYQGGGMPWEGGRADHPRGVDPRPGYLFFTAEEGAFIDALTERFAPKDELGPGAIEICVPLYIDRQLAGPFGQGQVFYMQGRWA